MDSHHVGNNEVRPGGIFGPFRVRLGLRFSHGTIQVPNLQLFIPFTFTKLVENNGVSTFRRCHCFGRFDVIVAWLGIRSWVVQQCRIILNEGHDGLKGVRPGPFIFMKLVDPEDENLHFVDRTDSLRRLTDFRCLQVDAPTGAGS